MTYNEIHRLYKKGFSKSAIARQLNISRNRVIDYLNKSLGDFQEFLSSLKNLEKKLDLYHKEILGWLRVYPDLSVAQAFDWMAVNKCVKCIFYLSNITSLLLNDRSCGHLWMGLFLF